MRRVIVGTLFAGLVFVGPVGLLAGVIPEVAASRSYAVVVSDAALGRPHWQAVVAVLRQKHDAALIVYPAGQVASALELLKTIYPRYAAFVATPGEAGREFVVAIHRMTRKLDDDPYTDLRWGIVTGYDAADALRIAKRTKPLVIDSAASSMGPGSFKSLRHGFASSETDATKFWIKQPGGATEELKVSPDPVQKLVEAFNTQSPDMFVTSGHATEKSWQVIYNKNLGGVLCKDGQLFGFNSKRRRFDINSPEAKIYMPMGNCLIGHIPARDCMATAWMHTGGVYQMFGYTTVTFHGYMGWGIGRFFNNKYSLSEAFYFNNQSLIRELQTQFPEKADLALETYDHRRVGRFARKHGIKQRKLIGHLWDRDVVAFYGDPAWDARHRLDDPAWRVQFGRQGESVTISIKILKAGQWGNRPLAVPFPVRVDRIRGVNCSAERAPLVTDDFALIPLMGEERKAGETVTLTFGAVARETTATSANQPARTVSAAGGAQVSQTRPFRGADLGLPPAEARQLAVALAYARGNRPELEKALQSCPEDNQLEAKARDEVWFGEGAAASDASDPLTRIYAATCRRGAQGCSVGRESPRHGP